MYFNLCLLWIKYFLCETYEQSSTRGQLDFNPEMKLCSWVSGDLSSSCPLRAADHGQAICSGWQTGSVKVWPHRLEGNDSATTLRKNMTRICWLSFLNSYDCTSVCVTQNVKESKFPTYLEYQAAKNSCYISSDSNVRSLGLFSSWLYQGTLLWDIRYS